MDKLCYCSISRDNTSALFTAGRIKIIFVAKFIECRVLMTRFTVAEPVENTPDKNFSNSSKGRRFINEYCRSVGVFIFVKGTSTSTSSKHVSLARCKS